MTDEANRVECHLVRDLLVPYAAGEVSESTRAWVNRHVAACEECQRAFAEATDLHASIAPAPVLSPAPEQRLMRRVRWTVRIVLAVILSLALAVGGLIWGIGQVKRLADIPQVLAVPAATTAARDAVELDLSPLRLSRQVVAEAKVQATGFADGALARFETPEGQLVHVWAYRFDYPRQARQYERSWQAQFHLKLMSFSSSVWDKSVAKFRSGGNLYYTWNNEGWFIIIAVSEEVREAARLRDQIRDLIMIAYTPS